MAQNVQERVTQKTSKTLWRIAQTAYIAGK